MHLTQYPYHTSDYHEQWPLNQLPANSFLRPQRPREAPQRALCPLRCNLKSQKGSVDQATQDAASKVIDNATPADETEASQGQGMQQQAMGGQRAPAGSDAAQAQSVADKQKVWFISLSLPVNTQSIVQVYRSIPGLQSCASTSSTSPTVLRPSPHCLVLVDANLTSPELRASRRRSRRQTPNRPHFRHLGRRFLHAIRRIPCHGRWSSSR